MIAWKIVRENSAVPYWKGSNFCKEPHYFYTERAAQIAYSRYKDKAIHGHQKDEIKLLKVNITETTLDVSSENVMNDPVVKVGRIIADKLGLDLRYGAEELLAMIKSLAKKGILQKYTYCVCFPTDATTVAAIKSKLRKFGFRFNRTAMKIRTSSWRKANSVFILFESDKDVFLAKSILGPATWECSIADKDIEENAA